MEFIARLFKNYDSYEYRRGNLKLSEKESKIMDILMKFGESIDEHGYDGGDYHTAMTSILKLKK